MKVVGRYLIEDFCKANAEAVSRMNAWVLAAEHAQWKTPADIKARYSSASILSENRVVFNIGGNRFRVLVTVDYKRQLVLIDRVGTHADYDSWKLDS